MEELLGLCRNEWEQTLLKTAIRRPSYLSDFSEKDLKTFGFTPATLRDFRSAGVEFKTPQRDLIIEVALRYNLPSLVLQELLGAIDEHI